MAVTQPNLTATLALLTVTDELDEITLADATGTYSATTNPGGYGLPAGPAVNDVTTVKILVTPNFLASTLLYTFTVASGVITAATLSIGGFTAASIFSALPSVVWPFVTADPFQLFKDYGEDPPTLIDDVVKVDYTIIGEVSAEAFEFVTTSFKVRTVDSECCVKEKFIALDVHNLGEDYDHSVYLWALLKKIEFAADYGDLAAALDAFTELERNCDSEC